MTPAMLLALRDRPDGRGEPRQLEGATLRKRILRTGSFNNLCRGTERRLKNFQ
jgi:hypothetical protein